MTVSPVACPFCHHPARFLFRVGDRNRRLSAELFSYYRCPECELVFLTPHPADLGRYYPSDYYGNTRTVAELEPEFAIEQPKLEIIQRFVPTGRLMEIGPSHGAFAVLAKRAGFEVSVIERDAECCRFLSEDAGIRAVNDADPAVALARESQRFDVIALWQVIEHLGDPWEFLRTATDKLRPGGVLALATPNPHSLQFKVFGRFWAHLDAPRHLQLIPAALIEKLGNEHGMDRVLLTSADAGVGRHNVFGWQQSVCGNIENSLLKRLAGSLSGRWARLLNGFEKGGFRGSSYTLVLRKRAA